MKGERLRSGVTHGHWKTTAFVSGLRNTRIAAPFVLDGPIDRIAPSRPALPGCWPRLAPGDVVVMENLSRHQRPRWREMIEAAGAASLPPALQPRLQPKRDDLRAFSDPLDTGWSKKMREKIRN